MALLASVTTPFGAPVGHHEVVRVEGRLTDAYLSVIVHSWPALSDCAAHGGNGATFVWPVPVPVENILAGTGSLVQRCEAALIAFNDPANPFLGAFAVQGVTDFDIAKATRWANIKQTRTLLDQAPYPIDDFALDADQQSRQDIMGAIMEMQITGATTKGWRCSDNVMRELTLAQIIQAGTGIAARRGLVIQISAALFDQLEAATTVAEVQAVVWPTEEP